MWAIIRRPFRTFFREHFIEIISTPNNVTVTVNNHYEPHLAKAVTEAERVIPSQLQKAVKSLGEGSGCGPSMRVCALLP